MVPIAYDPWLRFIFLILNSPSPQVVEDIDPPCQILTKILKSCSFNNVLLSKLLRLTNFLYSFGRVMVVVMKLTCLRGTYLEHQLSLVLAQIELLLQVV